VRRPAPVPGRGSCAEDKEEPMNQRVWALGVILLGLCGCASSGHQARLQSAEEPEHEKDYQVRTIGEVTTVANADPLPVSGVGLVIGLEGTGGGAPPGAIRTTLEDELRKRRIDNVHEILNSPTTSAVIVSGQFPAGARKGDPIDLEITLPPGSKTRSLRGGRLLACKLYNYDSARNINPNAPGGDRLLKGHPIVQVVEAPVQVGVGDGDDVARLRTARIWGGGHCLMDRPFYLILNEDDQKARVAQIVADRINETFHGAFQAALTDVAVAKTASVVWLNVPPQYRLNLPRYLRVVRLIPLRETEASRIPYRRRLEKELLDPAHTVTAALRLEALGPDSVPTLKEGLASEHPLVRFCAAEALAYLGDPSCGEELARIVEQAPVLRAFSLTALASLDEAICHVELRRLLTSPSAETRYGAFRALRALDEHEEAIPGDLLNDSFWLYRVAPSAKPLVHLSTSRRAEVILFGEDPRLLPPFYICSGDFVVAAGKDDDKCTITRVSYRHGTSKRQCSLKLDEILRTLTDLGGTYPDVVEILRRADHSQCVSCRIAVDALPQATTVEELARGGAGDPEVLKTHPEILDAKAELGATPTLFDSGTGHHGRRGATPDDGGAGE
jgi:hypothetical protein